MNDLGRVLIIEDNEDVNEAVSLALQIRWPKVNIVSTESGEKGIILVEKKQPNIVILDLGLPDISGFDVLKSIRSISAVPIIILTVRGEEADIIKGLELGADEYIVKPFRQLELTSRINALIRRQCSIKVRSQVISGQLCLYPQERVVIYEGKEINLTNSENIILQKLMENEGFIVSNAILAQELWGDNYPEAISGIKVFIRRLRQKIEHSPNHPKLILTKHGLGYLFPKSN
jgi:two-component system response regulator VicR